MQRFLVTVWFGIWACVYCLSLFLLNCWAETFRSEFGYLWTHSPSNLCVVWLLSGESGSVSWTREALGTSTLLAWPGYLFCRKTFLTLENDSSEVFRMQIAWNLWSNWKWTFRLKTIANFTNWNSETDTQNKSGILARKVNPNSLKRPFKSCQISRRKRHLTWVLFWKNKKNYMCGSAVNFSMHSTHVWCLFS